MDNIPSKKNIDKEMTKVARVLSSVGRSEDEIVLWIHGSSVCSKDIGSQEYDSMKESKGEEIHEHVLNNTTPPFSPLQNLFIMENLEQLTHEPIRY
jgi:hypothetical protein